jgi:hypothetical protein
LFVGIEGIGLQSNGYNQVIEIYQSLFCLEIEGSGVWMSGNSEGVLDEFVLQGCAFVGGQNGINIWIGRQSIVEIGPSVCFELIKEKAVIGRGFGEGVMFMNVSFGSGKCLDGFQLNNDKDHCDDGGKVVWPTLYPTWAILRTQSRSKFETVSDTISDTKSETIGNSVLDTPIHSESETIGEAVIGTTANIRPIKSQSETIGVTDTPIISSTKSHVVSMTIDQITSEMVSRSQMDASESSITNTIAFTATGLIGLIAIGVIIWFVRKKGQKDDRDDDQLTDFLDGEQSDVYTMALEDDIETRTVDMENRIITQVARDDDSDDDPIFQNEYEGSDDDGRGHAEFERNRPGRSSILNRPLLGHF